MRTYGYTRTEAFILGYREWSRSSAIVYLLTDSEGMLSSIAKGIRKPKNPFAASLESFSVSEIVYYRRNNTDLATLIEGYLISDNHLIKTDISHLQIGYNLSNLLLETLSYNQPDPELYRFIRHSFELLNTLPKSKLKMFLLAFTIKLIAEHGFCISCDNTANVNDPYRGLYIPDGSLIATNVSNEDIQTNTFFMTLSEYCYMRDIITQDLSKAILLKPTTQEYQNLLLAVERYLTYHYQKLIRFDMRYL